MGAELDISGALDWVDGLPRPQWDLIAARVEASCEPEARSDAWDTVLRQWLALLGPALGGGYEVVESKRFLVLAAESEGTGRRVLRYAERARAILASILCDVADFSASGKQVLLSLRNEADYYTYISLHFPEGEHGTSGGMHIRDGYPHIAVWPHKRLESAVAHELTHAALHHLSMPQWLEEGLARIVEHTVAERSLTLVTVDLADRHKRYWGEHGLDAFWRGELFSRSGKGQGLAYELAEVLVRLLVQDSQPRWFGRVREPQRRFFAFLRAARDSDCGETASREHLGLGLGDLAARFLGPGSWSPSADDGSADASQTD